MKITLFAQSVALAQVSMALRGKAFDRLFKYYSISTGALALIRN